MVHFHGKNFLLQNSEEKINEINWLPEWGKSRIEGMMKERPDWCISRQRSWGTASFVHK